MHDDNDQVDPILAVLTEYEQKLKVLHQNDQLAREAHRTFGSLATELERRTSRDRRSGARAGVNRRQSTDEIPSQD